MTHGKAIRTALLTAVLWAPAAAHAQTAASPEPDLVASVSQLLEWVDEGLGNAAAASQTNMPPPPALGEGPVGQAIGWLLGGEAQPDAVEAPDAPAATPVAATAVEAMSPPEDEPFSLTAQPRPVAAAQPQGLLLPVATP